MEKSMSHLNLKSAADSSPAPTSATLSLPPEALINSAEVRRLCGIKSTMSLWRWVHNPKLSFPKPIKIGHRNFWRRAAVVKWIANRERATISQTVTGRDDEEPK
jgi:predicted DNA-binding transcriptional regulator AlpA